ncbi:MAG: DUF6048 family protein [Bacteroidota bacterium]
MKHLQKYITSLVLIASSFAVVAQEVIQDSVAVQEVTRDSAVVQEVSQDSIVVQEVSQDSVTNKSTNFAVLIGADYGKGIESLVSDQKKWEVNLAFSLFSKVRIIGEYGYGNLQPHNVINNGTYFSEGSYFRGGGEYVFTVKPKIYLSLGLMFAQAKHTDHGEANIGSEMWDDMDIDFSRNDLSANWFEWILNTEAQTFRNSPNLLANVYWGTRIRIRFLTTDISQPDFNIYAIPGYGKTYSNIVPAVNFFIKYRIDI